MKKLICWSICVVHIWILGITLYASDTCLPCDSCNKKYEESIIPIEQRYLKDNKHKMDTVFHSWNVVANQKICKNKIFVQLKSIYISTNDQNDLMSKGDRWANFGFDQYISDLIIKNIENKTINVNAGDTVEININCCYSMKLKESLIELTPCGDCCCKIKYCFDNIKCQDGGSNQWTMKHLWWYELDKIECNGKECQGKNVSCRDGIKFYL